MCAFILALDSTTYIPVTLNLAVLRVFLIFICYITSIEMVVFMPSDHY